MTATADHHSDTKKLRRQAEEIASTKAARSLKNNPTQSPEEAGPVFHSLPVQQTESELQNEELRQKQELLDAARADYCNQPSCNSRLDIFNLTEFIDRSEGDIDLAREVANIFSISAPEYLDSIRKAVTAGETDAACHSAHKLKGAAANLALPLLERFACKIESHAKSGNLEKAERLLPELEQRLAEALETLLKVLISPQGTTQ